MLSRLLKPLADRALEERELFFFVGMGRSGTMFVSKLLGKSCNLNSYHEGPGDRQAMVAAYWNQGEGRRYIAGYKKIVLMKRILGSKQKKYCECNSYLRYHVDILKKDLSATIFHLVRDGRSVVRSIMHRNTFTAAESRHSGKLFPVPTDPYFEEWKDMDRFERVCWYWAHANRYLLARDLTIIRLEDIVNSYSIFKEQVLSAIGINIPLKIWEFEVARPKNVGKRNKFPDWHAWSTSQRKQFRRICGPVMERLNYDF